MYYFVLQDGVLFTGPGVRLLIGASEGYDGTTELNPPDLTGQDWDCIFIQGHAYAKRLEYGKRFLYCEYDFDT